MGHIRVTVVIVEEDIDRILFGKTTKTAKERPVGPPGEVADEDRHSTADPAGQQYFFILAFWQHFEVVDISLCGDLADIDILASIDLSYGHGIERAATRSGHAGHVLHNPYLVLLREDD